MDVQIYHQDLELTDHLREYVTAKAEKLSRYLPDAQSVRVDLKATSVSDVSERMVAQVTMSVPQRLLRAEERAGDIFTAFDTVLDKINRQIERYKGRRRQRRTSQAARELRELEQEEEMPSSPVLTGDIVRVKEFEVGSLLPEEAVEQMELLGHYFFVFLDGTDGRLSVVYKRHDENYGMIKPVY
jgi:putative sigma-54 modulation protein